MRPVAGVAGGAGGQVGNRAPARAAVAAGSRPARPASPRGAPSGRPSSRPVAGGAGGDELREQRLPARVAARPARPRRLPPRHSRPRGRRRRRQAGRPAGPRPARPGGRPAAERGQALLMVLGAAFAILFAAALLAALGGALTATARVQRTADLAALSAARSLRDDFPRLFTAPLLSGGTPNPRHLDRRSTWRARPRRRARRQGGTASIPTGCASRFRTPLPSRRSAFAPRSPPRSTPSFPGSAPRSAGDQGSASGAIRIEARAEAEASPPSSPSAGGMPTSASGGGYSGPLAYRQGKPMRPDVALGFDRLARGGAPGRRLAGDQLRLPLRRRAGAALRRAPRSPLGRAAGSSRFTAARPSSTWARPPPTPGWPPTRRRFGFVKRYSWEPWHFGYDARPGAVLGGRRRSGSPRPRTAAPAGAPASRRSSRRASGRRSLRAAARWNVSAALLAAQLMAESNFNPCAVSPAGAQGIAQFMPGTAAAYGLRRPVRRRAPRSTPRRT